MYIAGLLYSFKPDKSSVLMGPPFSTTLIASSTALLSAPLSNTTPIVVAVVVVLVAAIMAICAMILIVVIVKRKGAKGDKSFTHEESIQLERMSPLMELDNPLYESKY